MYGVRRVVGGKSSVPVTGQQEVIGPGFSEPVPVWQSSVPARYVFTRKQGSRWEVIGPNFSGTGPGFPGPMTSCRPVTGTDDFPSTTLRTCEHIGRIFVKN